MAVNKRQYSETIDHLLIKNFLTDNIPLENDVKKIDQEIKIGNRIADIFIEKSLKKKHKERGNLKRAEEREVQMVQRLKEVYEQNAK